MDIPSPPPHVERSDFLSMPSGGMVFARSRMNVVFPHPFSPRSTIISLSRNSPAATFSLTTVRLASSFSCRFWTWLGIGTRRAQSFLPLSSLDSPLSAPCPCPSCPSCPFPSGYSLLRPQPRPHSCRLRLSFILLPTRLVCHRCDTLES